MKKLEIITRTEKLNDLRAILEEFGVTGLNILHMEGYGNQRGHYEDYEPEKAVQLLPHKLNQILVAHSYSGATIREAGLRVVAIEKPVLLPFPLVNGASGNKRMIAQSAVGYAAEDAFADMIVALIHVGVAPHICSCPFNGLLCYKRLMGISCNHPIVFWNQELLFGLQARLFGFSEQRMAEVNRIFQNPLYRST